MKKKTIIALFFLILLICIYYYYFNKINYLFYNPSKFIFLIKDASSITSLTWKVILIDFLLSASALVTELLFVGWKNSGLKKLFIKPSSSAKIDWWCYLLGVFKLSNLLILLSTLGIFYFINSVLGKIINLNLGQYIENNYLQFLIIFIFSDFISYLRHRFLHLNPFWELHSYHHSAEEFNLITTSRGSFWEGGFATFFYTLVYLIMGAPIVSIISVIFLREWYIHLCHSNLNWNLGWLGKIFFISPLDHKLHQIGRASCRERVYSGV